MSNWRLNALYCASMLLVGMCCCSDVSAQNQTQAQQIFATFQQKMRSAGEAYQKKSYDLAGKELKTASELMQRMLPEARTASQRNAIKPYYEQLAKAVVAVRKNGVAIDELPAWAEALKASAETAKDKPAARGSGLSFVGEIGPMLAKYCGDCHMRRKAEGISMASYAELMLGQGGVPFITPGSASASRIMEVIEDGSMPKGPQKVAAADLEILRQWLDTGASYDGRNPAEPILGMVRQAESVPTAPSAGATVSFAKDIAPVLVENCSGCHLQAQQIRGNLNMSTFAQLDRGGMSGAVLQRGKGAESLLVQKLRGLSGQRMPANRPPLEEATIAKIETWINEGAGFDGGSPDASLTSVAEQAWVRNATDDQLKQKRLESAQTIWRRVSGSREAFVANGDSFVVLSDSSVKNAERVLAKTLEASQELKGTFSVKGDSLFPAGAIIFVFDKRYDYGEFGRMAEERQLPNSWTAHWRREGVNAYVAMVLGSSDDKAIERDLKINLAALWASGFQETPPWFADGMGAFAYGMRAGKNDPLVARWEQNGQRAMAAMPNIRPLTQNTMNEEDSAAIGFLTIRAINQVEGRKKYTAFVKILQSSGSFHTAFKETYGSFEAVIASVLGIKPN